MQKPLPEITYNLFSPSSENYRSIEVNGEVIHWIDDAEKFYEIFGYTQDMRKARVLPSEFVWDEYINNREFDFTACIQIQIIEYLRVHSHDFLKKYGNQCEEWLAALVKMRGVRPEVCAACKIQRFCSSE